jgi:hypothetical protein
MSEAKALDTNLEGRCLCGVVHISVAEPRPVVDVCHCTMCQRWTGGAFGGVHGGEVTVTGEEHVRIYRSSEWAERAFCGACGSSLWYRFMPTGTRSFLSGLFDLPKGFVIERQIFVDEKPTWFDFAQETPMLTGEQVIAEAKAAGHFD